MKRSALIIPILTGAVLAPVAPAVAVAAPAPVSQSAARQHAQVDAEQALAQVNARIAELHKIPQAQVPASEAPKVNYGEEIRKLLDTASNCAPRSSRSLPARCRRWICPPSRLVSTC